MQEKYAVIKSIEDPNLIICVINLPELHKYIVNHISQEFTNLVENCYYPKISKIFNDLLHMTAANEQNLIRYSKEKYGPEKESAKIAHDPYNT